MGCGILGEDGQLVGQGYHRRKGESHAEALALAQAGEHARNGTAVMTLEPCNHDGRTPPCHRALIDGGVRRVLIALLDPTSRGEGGVAVLHRAGLDVEVGVLADEALLVLGPWLCAGKRAIETRRLRATRWDSTSGTGHQARAQEQGNHCAAAVARARCSMKRRRTSMMAAWRGKSSWVTSWSAWSALTGCQ